MNPELSYIIKDTDGNIRFTFPPNTLLERIIDVWPLIINYYENIQPLAVGESDSNYRELTISEVNTDKFIKLFAITYRKHKITYTVYGRICVENFPLCIKGNPSYIYVNDYNNGMITYEANGTQISIINDIENIHIDMSARDPNDNFINSSLLVLRGFFD